MAYYLVLFPSYIIMIYMAFFCGENDKSTQTRHPDSDEGNASMGLFNNAEQDKEDIRSLNQFMEKAGMLTDDEFFGSL